MPGDEDPSTPSSVSRSLRLPTCTFFTQLTAPDDIVLSAFAPYRFHS